MVVPLPPQLAQAAITLLDLVRKFCLAVASVNWSSGICFVCTSGDRHVIRIANCASLYCSLKSVWVCCHGIPNLVIHVSVVLLYFYCAFPGFYMYIETSFPRTSGDIARLFSPFVLTSNSNCGFSFWYHMYGTTINTLNVYVLTPKGHNLVWTKSGNQGNRWISSGVISTNTTGVFQVCLIKKATCTFETDLTLPLQVQATVTEEEISFSFRTT